MMTLRRFVVVAACLHLVVANVITEAGAVRRPIHVTNCTLANRFHTPGTQQPECVKSTLDAACQTVHGHPDKVVVHSCVDSGKQQCLYLAHHVSVECEGSPSAPPQLIAPCGYCESDHDGSGIQGIKYQCSEAGWASTVCEDKTCESCFPTESLESYTCTQGSRYYRAPCPWLYTRQFFFGACGDGAKRTPASAETWFAAPVSFEDVTYSCTP
jgi:hypothetical protein